MCEYPYFLNRDRHDSSHLFIKNIITSQRDHELSRKRHVKNISLGHCYSLVQFHVKTSLISFCVC